MFRTCQGKKIENLTDYIKQYVEEHPNIQIIVGCDSQNYSKDTVYVTAVVLYTPGHGGHVIFEKERLPKERIRATRLMNEVWRSVDTANDIDVNPNPRWKSNEVFESARGLVEGMGYKCRYKSLNVMATCAADFIVRS